MNQNGSLDERIDSIVLIVSNNGNCIRSCAIMQELEVANLAPHPCEGHHWKYYHETTLPPGPRRYHVDGGSLCFERPDSPANRGRFGRSFGWISRAKFR